MRIAGKIARGVAGLAVLGLLLLVVSNWYGDFKSAPKSAETTSTVETTATTPPDGQGSPDKGGETAPASPGKTVVMLIDGVNFRATPDATSKAIRGLKKGETLVLVAKEGDWYHVTAPDGVSGYVTANPQYTRMK